MRYLLGIAFLFLASAVVAIFLSVGLSTLILKTWAYFAMDGFDVGFLMIQIIIAFCAAVAVNFAVDRIQKRIHV